MQAHIYCSSAITMQMHDVFVRFVLSQPAMEELVVYLSSSGGSPMAGFNLHSFLKSRPEQTAVYNMSNVDSAAVQLYLGFEKRYAVPQSTFLLHPTSYPREVLPTAFTQADARRVYHELESTEWKTEQVIIERTAGRGTVELTAETVRGAMQQTTVLTASQALEYGVADELRSPKIPREGVMWITEEFLASLRSQPQAPGSGSPPA